MDDDYERSVTSLTFHDQIISDVRPTYITFEGKTPPENEWKAITKDIRNNVVDILNLYKKKYGEIPSKTKQLVDAYCCGKFTSKELNTHDANNKYNKYNSHSEETISIMSKHAFFMWTDPFHLLREFTPYMLCYSMPNTSLRVVFDKKPIYESKQTGTVLLTGVYDKKESVVVKYTHHSILLMAEIGAYALIVKNKDSLIIPDVKHNMFVWGDPVLVMEHLSPISSSTDSFIDIGVQILNILSKLHKYMVHSDIKPSNIMKRLSKNKSTQYFLIDFGGSLHESQRKNKYYIRHSYTASYYNALYIPNTTILTTNPKNELIELGHTLRRLQLGPPKTATQYPYKTELQINPNLYRTMENDILKTYMDAVSDLPDYPVNSDYKKLQEILSSTKISNSSDKIQEVPSSSNNFEQSYSDLDESSDDYTD